MKFLALVIIGILTTLSVNGLSEKGFGPCDTKRCALINLEIVADNNIYSVGDAFYYNLTLKNIGQDMIDISLNISSEPPELLGPDTSGKTIKVYLEKGEEKSYQNGLQSYTFKKIGEQEIGIFSNESIRFVTESERLGFINNWDKYGKIFDVTSSWQRRWSIKTEDLNEKMLWLTIIITVLTAANVWFVYKVNNKKKSK